MTRQTQNRDQASGNRAAGGQNKSCPASLDPHLVALVKFLARSAAERNYKDIQRQSVERTNSAQDNIQGDAGADS